MAKRTPSARSESGTDFEFADVTSTTGDYFENQQGNVLLVLENSHATADSTFTIHANGTTSSSFADYGEMEKEDVTITVPAGEYRYAGPYPALPFNGDTGSTHSNANGLLITAAGGTPAVAGVI